MNSRRPEKKAKTDLLQGTLDLIVLRLLQSGPANGWDITQRMHVLSGETLKLNYGSLYPALHRLETRGWITSEWGESENGRKAKFYRLTRAGGKQLVAEREVWERFSSAMKAILQGA